ncbi:hypothetical protein [Williamsoniiplasma lucivorax]|uniref:N-acetyltransferase domain-containing protein n=1 Tax=Williamsoniiplasma lucivorax TaxID=209274 RepID=A0A2S5RFD5_9MOLU|nr:hypothetical protein [Williamsoniiplasma lucivorax]PPE06039.1 hypothetical protein ELUCI_v1c03300 [Williamsoniiplasma lucivorax]
MEKFELIYDYRDNKRHNLELLALIKREGTKSTYEDWMVKYHWDDNYIPFALVNEKGDIVCNVGVMKMNVFVGNTKYKATQLISLLIKDSYKNKGLEKKLLTQIVNKFGNVVDLIYSFDSTINDFLKEISDFKLSEEFRYIKPWDMTKTSSGIIIKKMDLNNTKDFDMLYSEIKHTTRVSPILSTSGDASIKMFNILKYYDRNVYYVPSKDAVVVFVNDDHVFKLVSVYSKSNSNIEDLLNTLVPEGTRQVEFGFIPDQSIKDVEILTTEHDMNKRKLYIHDISAGVSKWKICFPVLSRGR